MSGSGQKKLRKPKTRNASSSNKSVDDDDKAPVVRNMYDQYARFLRQLEADGPQIHGAVFKRLPNDARRVDLLSDMMTAFESGAQMAARISKCDARSARIRQHGNDLFRCKNDVEALQEYTRAAAHAAPNSAALALACGNRTAVHMRHDLFEECLSDLEIVKTIDPSSFSKKLMDRHAVATKALLDKRNELNLDDPLITNTGPSLSALKVNHTIPSASSSVKINVLAGRGRHVVAVNNISVGDIIAIEDPYAVVVDPQQALLHCHYCLKLCYALVPCDKCTYAMYCSKNCLDKAFKEHHEYECLIIDTLRCIDRVDHVALRLVIKAREEFNKIATYPTSSEEYKSDRYYEIHNLVSNKESRTINDLFMRAYYAAYYYQLLRDNTTFFKDDPTRENIFKTLMMHHMQTGPSNFHSVTELVAIDNVATVDCEIGGGAYSFLSMVNHACDPNVIRESYGSRVVLRAIATIPARKEVLDNYGYHHSMMEKSLRQKGLKLQYKFDCACRACRLDYPLYSAMPAQNFTLHLEDDDFDAITRARDISDSDLRRITKAAMVKVLVAERYRPSLNLCNMVEIVKQCFTIAANRRKL